MDFFALFAFFAVQRVGGWISQLVTIGVRVLPIVTPQRGLV